MQAASTFCAGGFRKCSKANRSSGKRARIVDRFTVREKELMDDFTRRIAREQFALGHMQVGAVALPEIFPVLEGQMVPIEDIPKMVHEGKLETVAAEEIERKYEQFRQEFTVVYRKTLTLSRELASELSYLEQEAASVLVDGVIEELKEKYSGARVPSTWKRCGTTCWITWGRSRSAKEKKNPAAGRLTATADARRSAGARSVPRVWRQRDSGAQRRRSVRR